jgi:ribosome-binding protein aMBF1 (putative translation factor)
MIELAKKLNLSEKLINEIEMLDEEKISVVAEKCLEKGFSALKKKIF